MHQALKFLVLSCLLLPSAVNGQDFLKNLITQSPGPLSNPHKEYDAVRGCIECHVKALGGELANDKCLDCHPKIEARIEEKWGYHRDKPICEDCHQEHGGREAYIFAPSRNWTEGYRYGPEDEQKQMGPFDHAADAGYELVGKHRTIDCRDCHTQYREHYETGEKTDTMSYLDAGTKCIDCHEDVYEHAFDRDDLLSCTECHSSNITGWKQIPRRISFDHDSADYKLRGKHIGVDCSDCHEPDPKLKRVTRFEPLPFNQCTDCHSDPHRGEFGSDCEQCHSVYRDWIDVKASEDGSKKSGLKGFDHSKTDFPLIGYHEAVACEGCHYREDESFKVEDSKFDQCSDCHGFPHDKQFEGQECSDCHDFERKFSESTFGVEEHSKLDFVLDGRHRVIDCQKCHFSGVYRDLPHEECSDCHRNAHPERQIDQSCNFCHVTTSFSWIQFDHNKQTNFSLTGQHREVACLSCHVDQVFKNMPADNENPNCQMCHADPHGQAMPDTCSNCHRTEGFRLVRNFDHAEVGKWELDGRHAELSCQKCHEGHLNQNYDVEPYAEGASPTACLNCHADIHNGEYGANCEGCHNTSSFEVEYGDKVHDLGFFRLEGAHDQMACTDCHSTNTQLQGTGQMCGWCHEQNDPHLGQFGLACGDCHNQWGWLPTKFRHNTTGFRLTGSHRYVTCQECHVNNIYQGLPNDCYFCHSDSYVPYITQHAGGVVDCADCHTTIHWNIRRGGAIGSGPSGGFRP